MTNDYEFGFESIKKKRKTLWFIYKWSVITGLLGMASLLTYSMWVTGRFSVSSVISVVILTAVAIWDLFCM